jgi:hypothetical protein
MGKNFFFFGFRKSWHRANFFENERKPRMDGHLRAIARERAIFYSIVFEVSPIRRIKKNNHHSLTIKI